MTRRTHAKLSLLGALARGLRRFRPSLYQPFHQPQARAVHLAAPALRMAKVIQFRGPVEAPAAGAHGETRSSVSPRPVVLARKVAVSARQDRKADKPQVATGWILMQQRGQSRPFNAV
jgi:hypothetical protein